jgi:hypothetical protein
VHSVTTPERKIFEVTFAETGYTRAEISLRACKWPFMRTLADFFHTCKFLCGYLWRLCFIHFKKLGNLLTRSASQNKLQLLAQQ